VSLETTSTLAHAAPEARDALGDYLRDCRDLVLAELERFMPADSRYRPILYDLMLDYPLRDAKALRPALCIATARSLGGSLEAVLQSAAVLELYHNAFLIHDDIEDASERRRDGPTLHRSQGVPIALNVGDAMLALALEPLFDNMRLVGLGKALRILKAVSDMARNTAEGQALELSWIRECRWNLRDQDYLRMAHQKTSHYTFIAPVVVGGLIVGASDSELFELRMFATALGAAFQIQDDVLNLVSDHGTYGKDKLGDLWEGKRTLILLHALRSATEEERARAVEILGKERPLAETPRTNVETVVRELWARSELSDAGYEAVLNALGRAESSRATKTEADVGFLLELIRHYRSLEHARSVARTRALRARHSLQRLKPRMRGVVHREFMEQLVDFVVERDH